MIGINIGSMNTAIAYAELEEGYKFKCDVILSGTSSRMAPTVLSYGERHRMIGEEANQKLRKLYKNSFTYLNRMIGISPDTEYGASELFEYSLTETPFEKDSSSGAILFKVSFNEREVDLPNEAILAAYINKLKQNYITDNKKDFYNVVFSVPDYFTSVQREALARAIKICDIDSFHIINESTAITLYYGYHRYKELFNFDGSSSFSQTVIDPNALRYVIFIDAGHSKTCFSLSELVPSSFRVIYTFTNPFFGGRNFDDLILQHCYKAFYNRYKIDISSTKRAKLRLMEQITKARKILSVNTETVISLDSVYDDYDISVTISRDEYEEIIKSLLEVFSSNLDQFYKQSKARIDKAISSVEMAGDLMRTPAMAAIVKNVTGKEMSRGILTDECISKGCAIYSANMNNALPLPGFKGIYHCNPYSIFYTLNTNNGKASKELLISQSDPIPIVKSLSLTEADVLSYDKISVAFYLSKMEVQGIVSSQEYLLVEYEINTGALVSSNNLPKGFNSIIVDVLIDNCGKIFIQGMKIPNADGNSFTNLSLSSELFYAKNREIYRKLSDDNMFINHFQQIEYSHLKADEEYKRFTLKRNQLETELYSMKKQCMERRLDQVDIDGQPLIERLNSIELNLINSDPETANFPMAYLESTGNFLKEIERTVINKPPKQEKDMSTEQIVFLNKVKTYEEKISFEFANILSGNNSDFSEEMINKIGDVLAFYRDRAINSEDRNEIYVISQEFDNEIKKYFH